jgi:hypothetical protein
VLCCGGRGPGAGMQDHSIVWHGMAWYKETVDRLGR